MFEEKEKQTTNLSELIDIVNKDDIPTNEFTIIDTDKYVILGKINEVIAYLEQLQATISSSDTKANQALDSALIALRASQDALTGSSQALESSNTAIVNANTAIANANIAVEQALEAITKANTADTKADTAISTANEALSQVTQGLGSIVYDNNNNLMPNVRFRGDNGINVDMHETDPSMFDIRLDATITQAIEDNNLNIGLVNNKAVELENRTSTLETEQAKALKIPVSRPTSLELVGIDQTNAQCRLEVKQFILDYIYPVNTILHTLNPTSPAELYGGEWEQLSDKFLIGASETYPANSTGGSADAVVVAHSHKITVISSGTNGSYNGYPSMTAKKTDPTLLKTDILSTTGEDGTNKNIPPYLAVYIWKRIA